MLLQPLAAAADAHSYASAVQQAHSLIKEGLRGREGAAQDALGVLSPEVGAGQPEIIADLRKQPPDYADADRRLGALAAALDQPGQVSDPGRMKADVHNILAEPRYAGLHSQDSLWNRFWNWVGVQVFAFLAGLQLTALPTWFWLTLLGAAVLLAAVVALLIVRTGWTRAGRTAAEFEAPPPTAGIDRFAQADAAAAEGDYAAALRSLVAAVATAVSGRPYWETSPLTVRELFRSSGRLEQLRPLLLAFELAVYGFRPVDEATYRRLAELAAPFRAAGEAMAAA